MNFFRTLVATPKTKKEAVVPDATTAKSPKEGQPAETTTVAQVPELPEAPKGMPIPPPPPPEPPKMESKAEPAVKPEEPKAAAKAPEDSKGKTAFLSLFRPKVRLGLGASKGKGASSGAKTTAVKIQPPEPEVEVDAQPVVEVQETAEEAPEPVQETPADEPEPDVDVQRENIVEPPETPEVATEQVVEEQKVEDVEQPQSEVDGEKADPSKAGTLEAAAKPEPSLPVQQEIKPEKKLFSFFKPKAPKKASPAPAAAAEAPKAKEEPKAAAAAAAAKTPEAVVENKGAAAATKGADEAVSAPKKLEKQNSFKNLFFKSKSQKRNSTDAGVQTEPAVAPPAEKAK